MGRPALRLGVVLTAADLVLGGCTRDDMTRLSERIDVFDCMVRDRIGDDPCPKLEPEAQPPRYFYRTLAGVECYSQRVQFGPDPVWIPAAPPDIAE